jgi:methionyl-tRNA formyltransferase
MASSPTRVVFMGTPDFAVPTLTSLLNAPDFDVVGVVTQPDRPAGRGRTVRVSPVKQVTLEAHAPILQPEKIRPGDTDFAQLQDWEPDFLVVVAFGQILHQDVLDIPRLAPVNVHASLLPRWRGAAPIQAAIRAGDRYTGITTMEMDAGMDTGPILLQDSIPIAPFETGQTLHDKLANLGANLLLQTLRWRLNGSIVAHPQPTKETLVTYAPQIKTADGEIDWSKSADEIDRHVRAFTPWPGTYTFWKGKRLKVLSGFPIAVELDLPPGTVVDTDDTELAHAAPLVIGAGKWAYLPTRLQLEGRQALSTLDFVNGVSGFLDSRLG